MGHVHTDLTWQQCHTVAADHTVATAVPVLQLTLTECHVWQ